ncbi:hypothetical protein [Herbiconiux sp.]|uniref:hypothetical protein n=1 Tax=Herbiconiux sp. TaxID=1871186 RepID=UPI0025C53607|nr:hypothetical protein [Herbiconiux sp.]
MMRPTFPIHTTDSDGNDNVGSAFLAAINGRDYLVTAAHVPTGEQPKSDWSTWPDTLKVHVDAGYYEVDLFSSDGMRTPKFGYLKGSGVNLADALWMPVDTFGEAGYALLSQHQIHVLEASIGVPPGTPLQVYGFPNIETTWPPPIQVADGTVIGIRGGAMIEADIVTVKGFSGGPALRTDNGQFLGLHIGHHPQITDPGQIVPSPVLHFMISQMPM